MERFSFELTDRAAADALREEAEAHGRTIEAELTALVERTYTSRARRPGEAAGDYLVRLTRPGFDAEAPPRAATWQARPVFGAD